MPDFWAKKMLMVPPSEQVKLDATRYVKRKCQDDYADILDALGLSSPQRAHEK